MNKYFEILTHLNIPTIRFNFKYFPFKQAIRFPVFLSRKVLLSCMSGHVSIEGRLWPGKVKIGYGEVGIFDRRKSRSIWQVSGKVVFKGHSNIGHGSKISVNEEGILIIGENFNISAETSLICNRRIEIGANCMLAWEILLMDTDLHTIRNKDGVILNTPRPVIIGDNVWVGCRCTLLKGTQIPAGSIIAAGTIISKALEGNQAIFGGTPVRILKENISWHP
ncbi:DapH/DapD/GlmU-related protein [Siphonobacter sp. SORGH_AS_1065]|uniref:acyltransferase n=1 Tax=Siphonobacter sp. SORGH_AS_1065 TaxID=3041795 RepID=UPI00278398C4|nr:acyltransferase [Siphonobacter sp. SORGH_AS_1065]MDQ1090573.1 acetyltransferase-like isoleucine patch superfamily enzyme [Siphonobacter sp. SORGH_AS_1065]